MAVAAAAAAVEEEKEKKIHLHNLFFPSVYGRSVWVNDIIYTNAARYERNGVENERKKKNKKKIEE